MVQIGELVVTCGGEQKVSESLRRHRRQAIKRVLEKNKEWSNIDLVRVVLTMGEIDEILELIDEKEDNNE